MEYNLKAFEISLSSFCYTFFGGWIFMDFYKYS